MTVGSLFAGIGGFDLGFERAGYDIRWQVEIDPWARSVLAKHWPHVYRHDDIRTAGAHNLEAVDVLCGGFPCQDISLAGKGAGIADGTRSGLWAEYARLIRDLRPRYVVVENVAALLARGLGRVLGDLAACGYDAEWDCIPASAVGAPHQRDRLWLVAYPSGDRRQGLGYRADAHRTHGALARREVGGAPAPRVFTAHSERWQFSQRRSARRVGRKDGLSWHRDWPLTSEPFVRGGAHGVPHRVDRLRGLGNAIVPQIAEWIARGILETEARRVAA